MNKIAAAGTILYTCGQRQRLRELDADPGETERSFRDTASRDAAFQKWERNAVECDKKKLNEFRKRNRRPRLCRLIDRVTKTLMDEGFVQISTPVIMSRGLLAKMGIQEEHPLFPQIFWLSPKQCLRPMLAPHLYFVIKDLLRLWERPIRVFEVGPCFRKESRGATHSNEFTMANLAEFGTPETDRCERIQGLVARIMKVAGIDAYRLESEASEVYGETLDVLAGPNDLEVASCAMGPHPLDRNWQVSESWIGIGFGIERMLLAHKGYGNLSRMGRSLTYLDGVRLNI